jgi:hypothetical protein
VYIDDANEFDPVWVNKTYSAVVEEDVSRKEIIQVNAIDADGSPGLSKICQYHIMNAGVPFDIDENGTLLHSRLFNEQIANLQYIFSTFTNILRSFINLQ